MRKGLLSRENVVEYYNWFRLREYEMNCMDNLLSFNGNEYDAYMFCAPEEEERKVHTPYVEPQDLSIELCSSIHPINSKI